MIQHASRTSCSTFQTDLDTVKIKRGIERSLALDEKIKTLESESLQKNLAHLNVQSHTVILNNVQPTGMTSLIWL